MRGKLSRNGQVVAEGDVKFHETGPWSGQFTVSDGDVKDVGDYTLALDDGRSHEVNVTAINWSTAHDTVASFTHAR